MSKIYCKSFRLSSGMKNTKLSSIIFCIDKLRFQKGFASMMYLTTLYAVKDQVVRTTMFATKLAMKVPTNKQIMPIERKARFALVYKKESMQVNEIRHMPKEIKTAINLAQAPLIRQYLTPRGTSRTTNSRVGIIYRTRSAIQLPRQQAVGFIPMKLSICLSLLSLSYTGAMI